MSLQQWVESKWAKTIQPDQQEVRRKLSVADRDLTDAGKDLSADNRFSIAYSSVRAMCDAVLYASGFAIVERTREHELVIESLRYTLDADWKDAIVFLQRCRQMRNRINYDGSGIATNRDADSLLDTARRLRSAVQEWLERNHPDLL